MRHLQAEGGTTLTRRPLVLLAVGVWLVGLGIDQATKVQVLHSLTPGVPHEVVGTVLRFTLVFNPGAAFGLGTSFTVALSIFAMAAMIACLVVGLPRVRTVFHALLLGLLMAGISGNLHDRLLRPPGVLQGHVVDFIQLPHFAIFNIADICITVAAGLLILSSLRAPAAKEEEAEEAR
ncbi:signal peptidase II [Arachnia propionica]|uniref:signal peptidase II n=1 Tax=Arachnia propionica TaxID=1750 RepID=UPI00163A0923|nr:signal peptidase II [Arachnia propionica]